jgi:hypothetical protein
MSRFAAKAAKFEQSDEVMVLDCECSQCGRRYNGSDRSGGHCVGGKFGGCCKSFRSLTGFDKHRTGPFEPDERRCMTAEELTAKGWSVDDNNTWRMPAPAVNPWGNKS